MPARRPDYTFLNQLNEIPYNSLETCVEVPAQLKALHRVSSAIHSEGLAANTTNRSAASGEKNFSGISKFSTADRGLDCDENQPLISEKILGSQYVRARSNHLEYNPGFSSDRFALGERCYSGPVDRFSAVAAAEHSSNQSFEQSVFKVGLWGPADRATVGDGSIPASSLLQRQSSGSSFTDSLLSSDVPLSTLSPTISLSASDSALFGAYSDEVSKQNGARGIRQHNGSCQQSWAQLTEQSYNLQLTLALRLVAETQITEEPLVLPYTKKEKRLISCSAGRSSVEAIALRFWVNGSLGYADKIDDGFYHIWGMNPYVWAICSHPAEGDGRIPTLDSLREVNPADTSMEVITLDKHGDSHLCDLESQAFNLAVKAVDLRDLAELLGKLVSENMGGTASTDGGELVFRWKSASGALKECLNCVVLPIGSLSVGLCRHRALLYKFLADSVNLPCRIARGCAYCGRDDGASCITLCGTQREFLVDLISNPGTLSSPEAFLKSLPLPAITSPLRLPELKASEMIGDGRLEASILNNEARAVETPNCEQNYQPSLGVDSGHKGCNHALWGSISNTALADRRIVVTRAKEAGIPRANVLTGMPGTLRHTSQAESVNNELIPQSLRHRGMVGESFSQSNNASAVKKDSTIQNVASPGNAKNDICWQQPTLQAKNQPIPGSVLNVSLGEDDGLDERRVDPPEEPGASAVKSKNLEVSLALDGLEVAWEELTLHERIGAGSFGTVHRADWNGSDVAVKILIEQDFFEERLKEFMREVAIMKRVRHPNVVLFMGAVTKRPNLSIVTEYLPKGSLFRLLHRTGVKEMLDEKRRIRMALDVAKGMNYLHRLNPPIVHRDLKSPNLLVDKTWTVKVCDFGLSRFKTNTFLSSRSAAGTAEWMAPEVLRDEPSNEKSDVYSFGVILWEIVTLQQPWSGSSAPQVVGAVGFQQRRLQIPKDVNPEMAALIESCWANDSWQRPSFASIMESLKELQRRTSTPPVGMLTA